MRPCSFALIGLLLTSTPSANAALWPSSVARVERDLHSQEVEVRRHAAESLRELPASSGARLSGVALGDPDVEVRLMALDACLALGVRGVGERLVSWLSDGERRLRLAAARALSESPSPRAVPSLGRALGDGDVAVRSAAASALGRSSASEAVLALLGHLDDAAPEVRRAVAISLGELGDKRAVVPLIGKIQDARPMVREGVAQALAQLADPRAVSALLLALHDADDDVKIAALKALAQIAEPSAVPGMSALLGEAGDNVALAAVDALSRIHTPAAAKVLIAQLDTERPGAARAEVVLALGRSGPSAAPVLKACLNAESDPDRLGGCALALGKVRDVDGALAIQEALRRGALRPLPALLALSELGAPQALPTVLEYLSDADVLVRRAARTAAQALLDPEAPDGRAVEPLAQALLGARRDRAEQAELLDLLGATGSARAEPYLLPFAGPGDDLTVRSHALSALGLLGDGGQSAVLFGALDDESGKIRLAAALALGRLRLPGRAEPLLRRFQRSNEQDRPLLLFALGGAVAHEREPFLARALAADLGRARDGDRDALIELLGRSPSAGAIASLVAQAGASPLDADRAKFAEALASHPAERGRLLSLLKDRSVAVRANAAWSLGEVGTLAEQQGLETALGDAAPVAANALQALARLARRAHSSIAALACPRLSDPRSPLRAAALRALRLNAERCEHGEEIELLGHDRAEFVRQSAAALLRDVPRGPVDEVARARARERDASGAVAGECDAPPSRQVAGVEPTVVVVIPPGDDLPRPSQPFTLLRADGLLRFGWSDRRGQLFEANAPRGSISLIDLGTDLE